MSAPAAWAKTPEWPEMNEIEGKAIPKIVANLLRFHRVLCWRLTHALERVMQTFLSVVTLIYFCVSAAYSGF